MALYSRRVERNSFGGHSVISGDALLRRAALTEMSMSRNPGHASARSAEHEVEEDTREAPRGAGAAKTKP